MAKLEYDLRREALRRCFLFSALSPQELDEIIGFAIERRYRRGQTIFQKDDTGSSLMAVLRGRVHITAESADGREIILNVINPADVFGEIALLDGKPRSAAATAVEDTHLLVVERNRFVPHVAKNPELAQRLLEVLCDRLRRTSVALEQIALCALPARLARVLLKLAADYGRPGTQGTRIDIKLSQKDLSNLVAASRESVNKQLVAWREDGLLAQEDGRIVVRRAANLEALAELN